MSGELGVAIVGARGFGKNHLRALASSSRVGKLVLVGRDVAELRHTALSYERSIECTDDLAEVLRDPAVDVLDIVLPHHLHRNVALLAFAAGKHVITEKPAARTRAELFEMITGAAQANRRLFCVLNLLFDRVQQAARRAIDSGDIGRPFFATEISLWDARRLYQDPGQWRTTLAQAGGGIQIDGGFHTVYRHLFLLESCGQPMWVLGDQAQLGVQDPTRGEDYSAITLGYSSQLRTHLMGQWTGHAVAQRFPAVVFGEEGTLVFTGQPEQPLSILRTGFGEDLVVVDPGPRGFAETATACVAHYLDCLATGTEPLGGLSLAAATQEILDAATRSGVEGRRLPLHTRFDSGWNGVAAI